MYLGIDLGTSELKTLLLADDHRIVGSTSAAVPISRPQPLWSEQDPEHWWQALDRAMQELAARHPGAIQGVRGIGLSGQMHGAVVLDRSGATLRPAILWNDGRSGEACSELEAEVPELHAIAGNLAMPGFTAPKLRWMQRHEPSLHARIARVLLPKDWLRWRLSGTFATDCSDASGTLWLDVGARRWSERLLAACGLTLEAMPGLVEGSAPCAALRPDLATRWGLRAGTVIAGGAGDNAASAVGIGAVASGQGFLSLGTSGVVFVCSDRFLPDPPRALHAFCHALPGRWHQMSVMLSAASALRWATQLTGRESEAALVAEAERLEARARSAAPLFLPYLSGERTPHNDPHLQGTLLGLGHDHGSADVGWAVLEGVSFGLLDGFEALDRDLRGRVGELALVGGGARSRFWGHLLAALLERPLVLRSGAETGAALGAARLAWLADGADESEVCRPGDVLAVHHPEPALKAMLAPRLERFREAHRRIRGFSTRAAGC